MSTPNCKYENDQRTKINIFGDFEKITPTHIGVAHAFSKFSKSDSQGIRPKL